MSALDACADGEPTSGASRHRLLEPRVGPAGAAGRSATCVLRDCRLDTSVVLNRSGPRMHIRFRSRRHRHSRVIRKVRWFQGSQARRGL
eukprot:5092167-Prymnesium_polylepis.1